MRASGRLLGLAIVLAAIFAGAASAQSDRRVALVIGIGTYNNLSSLPNPVGDARAIAESLRGRGFEVFEHYDLPRGDLLNALEDFQAAATGAAVALVYYAGHGMEMAGENVLAPIDTEVICEPRQARRIIKVDELFEALGNAQNQVVLLDACRNDPFPQCASRGAASGSGFRGLQRVGPTDTSLIIANATLSGSVAADGDAGGHSPFATALLSRIASDGGVPLRDMLDRAARDVKTATGGGQVPEISTQGGAPDICIDPTCSRQIAVVPDTQANATPAPAPAPATEQADKVAYEAAVAVGSCGALKAFVNAYPSSFYAALAQERATTACSAPPQEQQQAAVDPQQPAERGYDEGFIFPDSSARRLTRGELKGLSPKELRIARNEIFARNGRFFQSDDLTQHFSQYSWYQPRAWEVSLNSVENYNVELIQAEEGRR